MKTVISCTWTSKYNTHVWRRTKYKLLWINLHQQKENLKLCSIIETVNTDDNFEEPGSFSLIIRGGVTFHSLLVTCWNSLVARYSLQNHQLLVAKSLVTRCKICSLLAAEVARCKKLLVTRCKKSPVTCCKIRSLLVSEVARCKKSLVTRCKIRSLVSRCRSCSLKKMTRYSLQSSLVTGCRRCSLSKDTIEISMFYILPMYPLSLTLSTLLPTIQKPSS